MQTHHQFLKPIQSDSDHHSSSSDLSDINELFQNDLNTKKIVVSHNSAYSHQVLHSQKPTWQVIIKNQSSSDNSITMTSRPVIYDQVQNNQENYQCRQQWQNNRNDQNHRCRYHYQSNYRHNGHRQFENQNQNYRNNYLQRSRRNEEMYGSRNQNNRQYGWREENYRQDRRGENYHDYENQNNRYRQNNQRNEQRHNQNGNLTNQRRLSNQVQNLTGEQNYNNQLDQNQQNRRIQSRQGQSNQNYDERRNQRNKNQEYERQSNQSNKNYQKNEHYKKQQCKQRYNRNCKKFQKPSENQKQQEKSKNEKSHGQKNNEKLSKPIINAQKIKQDIKPSATIQKGQEKYQRLNQRQKNINRNQTREASLNQARSHITNENSLNTNTQSNKKLEQSSIWQPSDGEDSKQEQDEHDQQQKSLQKQFFECHQIEGDYPSLPPVINRNYNDISFADTSLLHELYNPTLDEGSSSKKQFNIEPIAAKMQESKSKKQQKMKEKSDDETGRIFTQKDLEILGKMFESIPEQDQFVFVQFRVSTGEVSWYKTKNLSSKIYNVDSQTPEKLKGHKFILLQEFQKSVPRDQEPKIQNRLHNQNVELKASKITLAKVRSPLNLLDHKDELLKTFNSSLEIQIIAKIEKNKQLMKRTQKLISVEQVTLKCSSCNNKKSWLYSDQIVKHLCSTQCTNFLRFNIDSISIC